MKKKNLQLWNLPVLVRRCFVACIRFISATCNILVLLCHAAKINTVLQFCRNCRWSLAADCICSDRPNAATNSTRCYISILRLLLWNYCKLYVVSWSDCRNDLLDCRLHINTDVQIVFEQYTHITIYAM